MTENSGIARAFEVLGERLAETENFLRNVQSQLDLEKELHTDANIRLTQQLEIIRELAESLKQAEDDRDTACSYALQLERLLEECRKAHATLKEGGADNCKKS